MPSRIAGGLARFALPLAIALMPLGVQAAQITVFAAASLKTALDEVAQGYAAATGDRAVMSFAGSSQLARQIEQGAPADVFISANEDWMDRLAERGAIDPASRSDLLGNGLVLVAPADRAAPVDLAAPSQVLDRLGEGRLAMALVDAVPAGIYGKAALTHLGLWPALAPHVAQADNVRAALALVSAGEAPLGVVYRTDAAADPGVAVVATFPPDSHPPIRYPAAAVTAGDVPSARRFLTYLRGPGARAAFARQGFAILE